MTELNVSIVPAEDADAEDMAAFLRMSTYGLIDVIFEGRSTAPWFADPRSRHRRGACLKAVVSGRLVGHAVAHAASSEPDLPIIPPLPGAAGREILDRIGAASRPGSWYLSSLAVGSAFRRLGVGRRLAAAALGAGRARGFEEASLHVFEGNRPAFRLYLELGFRPVSTVALPEPRDPAIHGDGRLIAMTAPLLL